MSSELRSALSPLWLAMVLRELRPRPCAAMGMAEPGQFGGSIAVVCCTRYFWDSMRDKFPDVSIAEEAYRDHHGRIFRFLLRKTGNRQDAEDLTQRVFVDAVASLSSRRKPKSVLAWLYAVAERRFVDEMRRRSRRPQVPLSDDHADRAASAARELPRSAQAIMAAVNRLPSDQREVIVLRLFDDLRFAEIGASLGISEAACKMRFLRGLRRLQQDLQSQGIEP